MSDLTGGCLCAAVRYKISAEPQAVVHCHCTDCRKSSGTGHGTHIALAENGLDLTGRVTSYERPADSGNIVSRSFCPSCGSPLYSRNSAMPGMIFVRASGLDEPNLVTPQMVVFQRSAPLWDHMDANLPSFAGMPDIAPDHMLANGGDT